MQVSPNNISTQSPILPSGSLNDKDVELKVLREKFEDLISKIVNCDRHDVGDLNLNDEVLDRALKEVKELITKCYFDMYNLNVKFDNDKMIINFDYDIADLTSGKLIDLSRFSEIVKTIYYSDLCEELDRIESRIAEDKKIYAKEDPKNYSKGGDFQAIRAYLEFSNDIISFHGRLAEALVNNSTFEINIKESLYPFKKPEDLLGYYFKFEGLEMSLAEALQLLGVVNAIFPDFSDSY